MKKHGQGGSVGTWAATGMATSRMLAGSLFVAGMLAGCAPEYAGIVVTVTDLPADTQKLILRPVVGGKTLGSEEFTSDVVGQSQVQLGLRLPRANVGTQVDITVDAVGSKGCVAASASSSTRVDEVVRYEVSLPLKPVIAAVATTLLGVHGRAANDVWAVGDAGTVWLYDGTSWQPKSSGLTATFNSVAALDTQNVWAVGGGASMLRYNGSYFVPQSIGATGSLQAVWAASASDVWAVGSGGQAWHYTGTTWIATDSKTTASLNSVYGLGPNQVWAVGDGGVIRFWDGSSWSIVATGSSASLRHVWAASASEIWAVGDGAIVQRSSGGGFTPLPIPGGITSNLYDVWGTSGAVWMVADNAVYRYASSSYTTLPAPPVSGLRAVSGSGPGDLWVAGLGGVLARYNGATWTREKTGVATDLLSVHISGTRAWLAGSNGTVLRKIL